MDEYISRKAAQDEACDRCNQQGHCNRPELCPVMISIKNIPAADVVSRDAFNRILAENDDMRAMLAQIGKKPGDSMADVKRVKRGKWIYDCERTMGDGWTYKQRHCSECGYQTVECDNFCKHCGADMREAHDEI